jgi:hypothetical protein
MTSRAVASFLARCGAPTSGAERCRRTNASAACYENDETVDNPPVERTAAASTREGVSISVASPPHVAKTIVLAAAIAGGVQTFVGVVNELAFEASFLNPDEEGSIFQIATAVVTAAGGVAVVAHAVRHRLRRKPLLLLGGILLYFAADDLLAIHERLGEATGEFLFGLPAHVAVRLWILVLAPLLVAAVVLLVAEARRADAPIRRVLIGGLATLGAAVLVEVGGAVTRSPAFIQQVSGKPETIRYLLEEALELAGWVLVAGGLWARALGDSAPGPVDERTRS